MSTFVREIRKTLNIGNILGLNAPDESNNGTSDETEVVTETEEVDVVVVVLIDFV